MKRIIPVIFFLFVIPKAFTQEIKIGVSVDPQFTWLSSDTKNVNRDGSYFGINGGIVFDRYFKKNYALHAGISIGTQGGGLNFNSTSSVRIEDSTINLHAHTTLDYKLQYLSIPVGLKLRTNPIGYMTYFVLIGFTNQFNLKAKGNTNDNQLNNDLINKEIRFYNLGYHFGVGTEYALSQDTSLSFGIVYNNGFVDITKNYETVKSRVLSFQVGVMF